MMSELRVTQIDHVSVVITNVERSRRFYRDLLGLKEIAKPRTFDFVVVWFDLGNQQLHLLLKDRPDTIDGVDVVAVPLATAGRENALSRQLVRDVRQA
jgi:catechol 2,3-dioxygenase-like lactoylglutathione lyase family enzyme